jgi:CheY-like chemotaxis protein
VEDRRSHPGDRRQLWRGGRRDEDHRNRPIVLIVDDHADCRELIRVVLGAAGIGTAEASSGAAAIARLRIHPLPAAFIVDLGLPDYHGTELIRRLHRDPATAALPVLVLSASVTDADRLAAADAGASAFLAKPVLPDTLLIEVRRLLMLEDAAG